MVNMNKDNFIQHIENMKNKLDKLKKVIIANPLLKDELIKLELDPRFYEIIYTKLVEKDKVYITDEEGKKALFGNVGYYQYMPYLK